MSNPFFSNKGPISLAQIFNILKITNEKKTDFNLNFGTPECNGMV